MDNPENHLSLVFNNFYYLRFTFLNLFYFFKTYLFERERALVSVGGGAEGKGESLKQTCAECGAQGGI